MADDDNRQDAGDTLGQMGSALKDDADQTVEDAKDAGEWVKDKTKDAKEGAENMAEDAGLNPGNPHSDKD